MPRHQPPDGLVGVERAERVREQPRAQCDARNDRGAEDELQQPALAHAGIEPEQEVPCPSDVRDLRTVRATRRPCSGPCVRRRDAGRDQAPRPRRRRLDPARQCVLGHRRLRVIDLETGEQPVTDESGEIVAVFNGEMYNFQALREELAARDTSARHRRHADHPPPLRGAWRAFVERLHGMFALALWDGRRRGSCSRATASARSRSCGRGSPTARSHSRRS